MSGGEPAAKGSDNQEDCEACLNGSFVTILFCCLVGRLGTFPFCAFSRAKWVVANYCWT